MDRDSSHTAAGRENTINEKAHSIILRNKIFKKAAAAAGWEMPKANHLVVKKKESVTGRAAAKKQSSRDRRKKVRERKRVETEREREKETETYDVATLERRIASVYIAGRGNGGHIYVVCWWSSLPMPAKPRNTCKMS